VIDDGEMRIVVVASLVVLGCGGAPEGETPPDAPLEPDPFEGMFDDISDFPRTNCTPGSLAGFAHVEIWPQASLRTTFDGELATYLTTDSGEELLPHVLTDDDLFLRFTGPAGPTWQLEAIDICGVDADGTVRGSRASCSVHPQFDIPCMAHPFEAPPLHRIPGEAEGLHLALLGEIGGAWPDTRSSNVRVDGGFAYVSRFEDGLRIVSVANPAAPFEVGHLKVPMDFANDLKIVSSALGRRYVITASTTTNVIDVTDPSAPALVAQLPFSAHSVFVEGTAAYLVDSFSAAVEVWDLALPRSPRKLGAWTHPDDAEQIFAWHDIHVANGIAYLSDIDGSGLHVVDFSDPEAPVVLGGEAEPGSTAWHSPWLTTIGGKPVALDGVEGTSNLRLLDGDPASPTFLATLGEWQLRPEVSMHNVMAIGELAYLAHYHDGIRVLDLANPAAPAMIGYYNTWIEGTGPAGSLAGAFGLDLDPVRKRIYVADSLRGLLILEGDATVFP
jgi:hypothetical protein